MNELYLTHYFGSNDDCPDDFLVDPCGGMTEEEYEEYRDYFRPQPATYRDDIGPEDLPF